MIIYENCEYYSIKEVQDILNVKNKKSVMYRVNKKEEFRCQRLKIQGEDYINRRFIDNIIKNRSLSVNIKETAKLINRSIDSTRDILHKGELSYFIDIWDNKLRVFEKDICEFVSYKECYSMEELASIFNISVGNITKKIRANYSNVNKFKKIYYGKKFYVEKEFLNHLKYIEQTTTLIEDASKKIGIRQKDIENICISFKDDVLNRDFNTGKLRVNTDVLETISEVYNSTKKNVKRFSVELKTFLKRVLMSEEKLQQFCLKEFKVNINKQLINDNNIKCISTNLEKTLLNNITKYYEENNDLNLYSHNDEAFTLKELNNIFPTAITTMAKKIKRGRCSFESFLLATNKKILVRGRYLDYLRKCRFTSSYISLNSKITKVIFKLNKQNVLIFDLFSSDVIIKVEDLRCLENNIKYYLSNQVRKPIKKKVNNIKQKLGEGYIELNDLARKLKITREILNNELKNLKINNLDCTVIWCEGKKIVEVNVLDELKRKLDRDKKEYFETYYIKVLDVQKEFRMLTSELQILLEKKFKIDFKHHVTKNNTGSMLITKKFYTNIKELLKKEYSEKYIRIEELLEGFGEIERITLYRLIKYHNKIITDNIELFIGNNYVKKIFVKDILIEVNNYSKDYLKNVEDKYIDKVNLTYVLEKYTLNRGELEKYFVEILNCDLEDHLIKLRGGLFIKKIFLVKVEENIDNYTKSNIVEIKNLGKWSGFSAKYSIRYSVFVEICNNNLKIEVDREIYYIYKCMYFDKLLLQKVKKIILKSHSLNNDDTDKYTDIRDLIGNFEVSKGLLKKVVLEYGDKCIVNKGIYYMKNDFIKEIQYILNETSLIIDIAKKYNIIRRILIKSCEYESIKLIKSPFGVNKYRINKDDIKRAINSKVVVNWKDLINIQNIKLFAKDELEYYKMMIEKLHINKNLIKTFKLFNNFAIQRITNSNGKNSRRYIIARKCCTTMKFLNDSLNKELLNCSDEDVLYLISISSQGADSKILRGFVEYCRNNTVCKFNSIFTYSELKKNEGNDVYDIYSKEEWKKIAQYLTNIDIHILKAFDDQRYSCLWLLGLLHLVTTWRINDMVTKIPSIDVELIGIYDFEWFKEGNEFKLSMAQSVLRILELKLSGVNADKNNQQLRFYYNIEMAVPLAIAYVIAEVHRRKNNNDKVFSRLLSSKFEEEIAPWVCVSGFKKLFFQTGIPKFSNLKANRTLLTYMYEVANEIEGNHSISYILCGAMRSHKVNSDIQLPIATQIYLKPIINSEDANAISYNLLKRGFFGWIPYKLLEIAYSDENKIKDLEMNEVTEMVCTLREEYGLLGLEALAKYFNLELYQKNNVKVLNELMKLKKSQLKEIIRKLLTNESSSKHEHGACLKGNICEYPDKDSCTFCEYFVKNVYFLYYINEEINSTLDKISKLSEAQRLESIKQNKVLFNLLGIVTEAKIFYYNYDPKFVDAFIDVNGIKEKIKNIRSKLISL
ncbi:hypothetical protein [Clostridium estertheticum]|uniref:Uncharacterized protein n=1 Tax=Clostridium estertheticum TaxID=238834 RepID=A0AA47EJ69_9CLOT|nr:hypothetical protein [Clostridium estertheticum]MBU3156346.1 hypothetical protein [Clostridium estertheticum]WAG59613.1 hypothetical protein LL038_18555 [Clostridium estertheticum]